MICFHKWGKWSEPKDTTYSYWVGGVSGGIKETDEGQIQDRTCRKCSKYQWSKI